MTIPDEGFDRIRELGRLMSNGDAKLARDAWRLNVQERRKLAIEVIRNSTVGGDRLVDVIFRTKRLIGHARAAPDDRNIMNVFFSSLRFIHDRWHRVSANDQRDFLASKIVYSSLAKKLRNEEAC